MEEGGRMEEDGEVGVGGTTNCSHQREENRDLKYLTACMTCLLQRQHTRVLNLPAERITYLLLYR